MPLSRAQRLSRWSSLRLPAAKGAIKWDAGFFQTDLATRSHHRDPVALMFTKPGSYIMTGAPGEGGFVVPGNDVLAAAVVERSTNHGCDLAQNPKGFALCPNLLTLTTKLLLKPKP